MLEHNQQDIEISEMVQQWGAWLECYYRCDPHVRQERLTRLQGLFDSIELGNTGYICTKEEIYCLQPVYGYDDENDLVKIQPKPLIYDGERLMLYRHWQWEQKLAERIAQFIRKTDTFCPNDEQKLVEYQNLLTSALSYPRDERQKNALNKGVQQNFTLITGGPGTGKTFTLAQIIAMLNGLNPDLRIAMAAPTGKAAQRMQEALQNALNHLPSELCSDKLRQQQTMTLHRLLGLGHSQTVRYTAKNPLPYDVVVVDEASMLSLKLAYQLFEAIPSHGRLILLGDAHQLASVEAGSVLADFQALACLKPYREHLLKSHRFVDQSPVGVLAKWLLNRFDDHEVHRTSDQLVNEFLNLIPEHSFQTSQSDEYAQFEWLNDDHLRDRYYALLMQGFESYVQMLKKYQTRYDDVYQAYQDEQNPQHQESKCMISVICKAFDDYRILTATQKGHWGTEQLNQFTERWLYQAVHSQEKKRYDQSWYIGRAVMIMQNDYQLGVSNGDVGVCLARHEGAYMVYFPSLNRWYAATRLPSTIQTAFAMTIHKSQGSEFTLTAVILDDMAERLLSQELIYTAITRAKKAVRILATPKALGKALREKTQRTSGLIKKIERLTC